MSNKQKNLFLLSTSEKYDYLRKVIYEQIKHSHTGRLMISTHYAKKVAELLGGNYEDLSDIQKDIFRSDIVFEQINVERGFFYTNY